MPQVSETNYIFGQGDIMDDMTNGADLQTKIQLAVMKLSPEKIKALKEYLLQHHPELAQILCN